MVILSGFRCIQTFAIKRYLRSLQTALTAWPLYGYNRSGWLSFPRMRVTHLPAGEIFYFSRRKHRMEDGRLDVSSEKSQSKWGKRNRSKRPFPV